MDFIVALQIVVLLGAIFVGVRLGGIGIGYAGGAGVLILGLCLGMKPGNIPWDVILIIASVISATSSCCFEGLSLCLSMLSITDCSSAISFSHFALAAEIRLWIILPDV